jgi:predicted transcriptional regulator
MPARDAQTTLTRAVESILRQTLTDFELVAVDDGSTDETRALLNAAAARDPRVRVVEGRGQGLVAALNLGLAQCRAPLVARMDADDESLPERLSESVAALEAEPTLSGVGTQVDIFRDDRPMSPNMAAYGRWLNSLTTCEQLFADRFVESPLCHPSVTLRRAAVRRREPAQGGPAHRRQAGRRAGPGGRAWAWAPGRRRRREGCARADSRLPDGPGLGRDARLHLRGLSPRPVTPDTPWWYLRSTFPGALMKSATTVKLPLSLKKRVKPLARASGLTAHAWMVEALADQVERAERRAEFVAEAVASRQQVEASGLAFEADAVFDYLRARVSGSRAARPRASKV